MNKQRRKEIAQVISKLQGLALELEMIKDDEEMYLDNMPENLQYSIKADDAEEAIDNLEDAISDIEDIVDNLSMI